MRIKEVAERSGFSAPTLRYYEEIGLLPAPARTPSGYRTYDERTLDRLAFIARAKQLGCTLEEIADLTTAWDGGRCGPIQDRLRDLVAEKLATAGSQLVELMTLSSELQRAAADLERHRPDGPCDDRCGCVTAVDDRTWAVSLTSDLVADGVPIACTLHLRRAARADRGLEGAARSRRGRQPLDDGVRVELGIGTPLDALVRLVAAEHDCCRFFRFAITIDSPRHRPRGPRPSGLEDGHRGDVRRAGMRCSAPSRQELGRVRVGSVRRGPVGSDPGSGAAGR